MSDRSLYDLPALFDALLPLSEDCASFYSSVVRSGSVLELGCGTGMLATALARLGNRVTGLDASGAMLDAARQRAAAAGVDIAWREEDMRRFAASERYTLVIAARNSLLHLHTIDDFAATFSRVAGHLTDDGVFAFDIFNPNVRLLARTAGATFPVMRVVAPGFGELSVDETFSYDAATQVGTSRWTIRGPEEWHVTLSLRSVFPQELPLLLAAGGLVLRERFGGFDRQPFTSESPRQVCIATRRRGSEY